MIPILLTAGVPGECIQSLFRFASESADSDKHVIAKRSNCDHEEVLFPEHSNVAGRVLRNQAATSRN